MASDPQKFVAWRTERECSIVGHELDIAFYAAAIDTLQDLGHAVVSVAYNLSEFAREVSREAARFSTIPAVRLFQLSENSLVATDPLRDLVECYNQINFGLASKICDIRDGAEHWPKLDFLLDELHFPEYFFIEYLDRFDALLSARANANGKAQRVESISGRILSMMVEHLLNFVAKLVNTTIPSIADTMEGLKAELSELQKQSQPEDSGT